MTGSKHTYRAGLAAEMIAAIYLFLKGYRLVGWRAKTPVGEIDLIAEKDGAVIFVEVKTRKEGAAALESVRPRAQGRIVRAALYYTAQKPDWQARALRFDVIALSPPFFIRHIDNAWRPQA